MKLSLEKTWTECLRMWKWIAGQAKKGRTNGTRALKAEWCEKHNYKLYEIQHNCFFCQYDTTRKRACQSCPARQIERGFHCSDEEYCWRDNPLAFYAKLVELNKIRRKAKR